MNTREQIVLALLEQLLLVTDVVKVQRRRPTSEEFKQMSDHQFPFVAVEAKGPQPIRLKQEARKGFGKTLSHHFSMMVDFYVYAKWAESPDVKFGVLYDDIYRILYTESLLDGLADQLIIEPVEVPSVIMEPYYLFRIKTKILYRTNGGI